MKIIEIISVKKQEDTSWFFQFSILSEWSYHMTTEHDSFKYANKWCAEWNS